MARQRGETYTLEPESKEVRNIKEKERRSTQHSKYQEVALKFKTNQEFREALGVLFDGNITHSLVGGKTVIVSSEHRTVFQSLKPKVSEVLSAGDLPPEEIAQLRRENLSFHDTDRK